MNSEKDHVKVSGGVEGCDLSKGDKVCAGSEEGGDLLPSWKTSSRMPVRLNCSEQFRSYTQRHSEGPRGARGHWGTL